MNIFSKIFCRTYQFIFKMAIPLLPYKDPITLDSVQKLPEVLKSKKIGSVLVVTDKFLMLSKIINPLLAELEKNGVNYFVYDETVPNPTVENVESARAIYFKNKCKGIIGFGGGSSMDCAKAVGARVARPKTPISKMEGILRVLKKTPFTIAIPTTAGTGSETTPTMVVCDGKGHKFPASDFCLIPDVAVLDKNFTKTLPPRITATTGMDALVHAVEVYIGNSTTKGTRSDAINALKLIFSNLEEAYKNGENLEARENMLKAAFLAGRAFSKSYVGYCHAVAHSLGGQYGIEHGLANSVILPYVLRAYGDKIHKKLWKLAVETGICYNVASYREGAEAFISKICEMNKNMHIPEKLQGIKKEDIPLMANFAHKEANPLYPVPVLMNASELEKFYIEVAE